MNCGDFDVLEITRWPADLVQIMKAWWRPAARILHPTATHATHRRGVPQIYSYTLKRNPIMKALVLLSETKSLREFTAMMKVHKTLAGDLCFSFPIMITVILVYIPSKAGLHTPRKPTVTSTGTLAMVIVVWLGGGHLWGMNRTTILCIAMNRWQTTLMDTQLITGWAMTRHHSHPRIRPWQYHSHLQNEVLAVPLWNEAMTLPPLLPEVGHNSDNPTTRIVE